MAERDERLIEILGFDPTTPIPKNEHGDFMNIGKKDHTPPQDIQKAFTEKIKKQRANRFVEMNVDQQHLFYSRYNPHSDEIERVFHMWGEGVPAENQLFIYTHSIDFKKIIGGFYPWRIQYQYEPSCDNRINDLGSFGGATIHIGDDHLRLDIYDPIFDLAWINYDKGKLENVRLGSNWYFPTHSDYPSKFIENDEFVINHTGRVTASKFKAPLTLTSDYSEKLFDDPELFTNPFLTSCEADNSWKNANIMDIFNISWESV